MSVTVLPRTTDGYQAWTRPADWLALPTVNVGDQKVVGLVAVYNTGSTAGNLFAVTCAGAYTVDWGDGTVENVATGTARTHGYTYASLAANDTSEGWRQAIITITPQAGQTLTSVTLNTAPTGTSGNYVQNWRDIKMAGSSVASLTLNDSGGFRNGTYQFEYVGQSALTSLSTGSGMRNANNLRKILGTQWTSHVTSFTTCFAFNAMLESVALLDTTAAISMSGMFQSCTRLRTVPLFVTSTVTDMSSMFLSCSNLQSVPQFDTSSVTTMAFMFQSCVSLTTIPLLNTVKVTTFNTIFSGCSALASVPALDTGACLTFSNMFNACISLTTLPAAFNTTKGTDFTSMFAFCSLLTSHPAMTVSAGITFASMFNTCSSLTAINLPTSSLGTSFAGISNSCSSLQTINLNMSATTSQANSSIDQTSNGGSTSSLTLTGLRFAPGNTNGTINKQLTAAAMNALYTSLGTASGAQTLTVSGNPGSGSSTTSIATAKGWTVVGG